MLRPILVYNQFRRIPTHCFCVVQTARHWELALAHSISLPLLRRSEIPKSQPPRHRSPARLDANNDPCRRTFLSLSLRLSPSLRLSLFICLSRPIGLPLLEQNDLLVASAMGMVEASAMI